LVKYESAFCSGRLKTGITAVLSARKSKYFPSEESRMVPDGSEFSKQSAPECTETYAFHPGTAAVEIQIFGAVHLFGFSDRMFLRE